jgi:UDP-GlcNAc:undecaprenyl-phosphate GlcNAc-1-phosphate transferase
VTVFWIVGMINSINFIDGLDGLSSGIALIAAITLGGISLTQEVGEPFVALFCFTLAGALAGFLRWNFHPASIFAGTSGTVLVGYTLAVLSVLGTAKVAVALLVLGVPILDTFWIIIRRVASGRAPFSPDRGHIHHRLLDLGLSHRNTVLVIYGVCALLAALSFRLSGTGVMYAFMGLVVLSGLGLLVIARATPGGSELELDLDRGSYEGVNGAGLPPAARPGDAPASADDGGPAAGAPQPPEQVEGSKTRG